MIRARMHAEMTVISPVIMALAISLISPLITNVQNDLTSGDPLGSMQD